MVHDTVAVSAPGKVLLAGGYLVLDRAYTGLVFGLDARIHVVVQPIPTRNGVVLNEIVVKSPQFENAVWEYGYRLAENGGGISVTQLRVDADLNLNRNPFIETTLGYTLSYITSLTSPQIPPASITILADNDYYSPPSNLDTTNTTQKASTRFHNFALPLRRAPKTGLGSSAALTTALTAALLTHYLPQDVFDLSTESGARKLHNLSQASHSAAQGKVGSGFDIASAVYGSCLYRRFTPTLLSQSPDPGSRNFTTALRNLIDETGEKWDTEIHSSPVQIPPGLRLVMCDVSHGSQTPGMVKRVLAWRAANPAEADRIWSDLHASNDALARELRALSSNPSLGLEPLRQCFKRIRTGIRLMSEKSGVPIEPPSQTRLLDACEGVEGVVGGVVPGAGGYDAISLLIEDREEGVRGLVELFAGWKFEGEGDSSSGGGGKVSMLGVREEMEGVRIERWEGYQEWLL